MHKNSEALFNKYALNLFQPNLKVLEIGPERQLYTKRNIDIVCPGITTPYHEDPIDCWRIWPEGFNALFTYAGLTDIRGIWEHIIPESDGYKHIDTIAIGIKPN